MELKHETLASSSFEGEGSSRSCEGEGSSRSREEDRFSGLPDRIAYRILSFLTIKDVACFSIVSKRCRELYLSTPSLDFEFMTTGAPWGVWKCFCEASCEVRLKLVNSLDRFLLQRGDNKIGHFRLVWKSHAVYEENDEAPCFCVNEHFRIMTWIHNALRCNVKVLDVKNRVVNFEDELYTLFPSCVFLCATLTSLAVDMDFTLVKTPSVAFSSNLVYLKLLNVKIEDEGFFKWISCSCKFIKEIFLFGISVRGNIIIKSSSLEKFGYVEGGSYALSHLNISGEKLEVINIIWRFNSPDDKSLNIFAPRLKDLCWRGSLVNQANLGELECLEKADICLEPKADDSDKLIKHFYSLHRVEHLVLNAATFQVSGFDKEYWKLQNLDFIDQIKEVTVELDGSNNGIEFARYILEHAKNLEQMCIQHFLDLSDDAILKLNDSKKMSKATVIFEAGYRSRPRFDFDWEED